MTGPRLASQRVMARAAAELGRGEDTWFTALGTSMRPAVGGRFWLHRVTEERPAEAHIAADNGMVNGWTPRASVYGVLC